MVNGFSPEAESHRLQAEHNYELIKKIDKNNFKDWFITVSFYVALHFVDSHASFRGIKFEFRGKNDISPHIQRLRYVRSIDRSLGKDYNRLYEEGRNARYDPLYFRRFKGDLEKLLELSLSFRKLVKS